MRKPTDVEIDAAARQLFAEGNFYGWWGKDPAAYDDRDPIGRNEFEVIVERVLQAAAKAVATSTDKT